MIESLVFVCFLLAADAATPTGCDTTHEEQQLLLKQTASNLESKGWKVQSGVLHFDAAHMYGQNAQSKYGRYKFNGIPIWNLGDTDAVLWVGCTPPPCEYFSMRSYVKGYKMQDIMGSLGDAANNLRFNSTGGSRSPLNFNRTTAVITTADVGTGDLVASTLIDEGFPSQAINWDWMPPSLLNMTRHNIMLETYLMLYRVSMFQSSEEGERYVGSEWPVLRLLSPEGTTKRPSPVPVQRTKGTGTNESQLKPSLDALQAGGVAWWSSRGYETKRLLPLAPIDIEGILDCVPNKTSCGGDNRDAAYFSDPVAYFTLPNDASAFLLVVGVNHNVTGKATYGNVVVETAPKDKGVFNMTCNGLVGVDSRSFGGTALPFTAKDHDKLYAVHVSRSCAELKEKASPDADVHCLQVDCGPLTPNCNSLRVVTRAYLEVATTTGPAYNELVWPRVVEFTTQSHAAS